MRKITLSIAATLLGLVGVSVATPASAVSTPLSVTQSRTTTSNETPAATSLCTTWRYFASTHNIAIILPTTAAFDYNCFLGRGDNSDGVWALQLALDACYHQNIATDGDFGPATQAALTNVQNILHITADGQYGPQTRSTMSFSESTSTTSSCDKFGH